MKKIYLLLALFVAINVSDTYAIPYKNLSKATYQDKLIPNSLQFTKYNDFIESNYKTNQIQALSYFPLDTMVNATNGLWGNINPVCYEPNLKSYYYSSVRRNATFPSTTLNVKYSTNAGANWLNTGIFFTNETEVIAFPSIGVANIEGNTNPKSLNYFIYTAPYRNSGDGNYTLAGGKYYISEGTQTFAQDLVSPQDNSTGFNYNFGVNTSIVSYIGSNGSFVAGTNQLDPIDNTKDQYGLYGTFGLNFSDFTSYSSLPREWWTDKFRASQSLESSFNAFQQIDVDKEGTFYVGVYNIFPNDEATRVPGVSKSTDGGKTWGAFSLMPSNLIENYKILIDRPEIFIFAGGLSPYAYTVEGFSVTGKDTYSFFFKLLISNDGDNNNIEEMHLVEASFNGNTWSLRKLADLHATDTPDQITSVTPNAFTTPYEKLITNSSLGNEIQSAKTSDGDYLIVKWIDMNDEEVNLLRPDTIYVRSTDPNTGVEQTTPTPITKLRTTDIYMSYRKINDFKWSQPINITNDSKYDKGTFIPKEVESLEKIALVKSETTPGTYNGNGLRTDDPVIGQRIIDRQQNVVGTTVNLLNGTSVEETTPLNYSFNLGEVYPNPAMNGIVEFSFTSDVMTNGTLSIYDNIGNKVSNVYEGIIENNAQGINFSTNNLSSGVYFATLNIGNKSITRKFTVIK